VEVTAVAIKLADRKSDKLRAYATITFDNSFVVRDVKVVSGSGGFFVAMPSRKLTWRCPRCRCKNHVRARYCNNCGRKLSPPRVQLDRRGRAKLHADIAHPICRACRDMIHKRVIEEFERESERSAQAGYRPRADEYDDAGPEGSDSDDDYGPDAGTSRSSEGRLPGGRQGRQAGGPGERRDSGGGGAEDGSAGNRGKAGGGDSGAEEGHGGFDKGIFD
jgi:stage V sporulation protein G